MCVCVRDVTKARRSTFSGRLIPVRIPFRQDGPRGACGPRPAVEQAALREQRTGESVPALHAQAAALLRHRRGGASGHPVRRHGWT